MDLELEEPTKMGDDVSSSENEEDRGVAMTLVERCVPAAALVGGGRGTDTRGDAPESRKHVVGEDATGEREVKRALSPRPSEASSSLSSP